MKQIEIIGNCDDYSELIEFVLQFDTFVFSDGGVCITKDDIGLVVDSDWQFWVFLKNDCPETWVDLPKANVLSKRDDGILIARSNEFMIGGVSIACADNVDLLKLFERIRKYVKDLYTPSFDKVYYAAPRLYDKWRRREANLNFLIKAKFIDVPISVNIEAFLESFKERGYVIEQAERDIRKLDSEPDFSCDLLIHTKDAAIKRRLIKRQLCCSLDSEAVFIWQHKHKKKPIYRFIADYRLFSKENGCESVKKLYAEIVDYWNNEIYT